MKYQGKQNTDHQFKNGYCENCGWSKKWAEINGWECPVSNIKEKSFNEGSSENEKVDFLKHHFVDGNCKKCGWSYEWARKKNEYCPVNERDKESWKDSKSKYTSQNERKGDQTSDKFRKKTEADKYGEILGLKGKVTIKDIKNNYRVLSKKYHPDRVSNLGIEFTEIADKKMKDINEAYDWFKKKYNI